MAEYQKRPEVAKKQVQRVQARRDAVKAGIVKKGDGKELDHRVQLDAGGSNDRSNIRVKTPAENRAWRAKNPHLYTKRK